MARRITVALLGSISFAALCAPVAAAGIETIVVTAQKRAESVKEVPMAVTVLTGDNLERNVATNFADYITSVPGMNYTASEPGHTQLILRGVNAGGVGSTVGTYVDETPYGSSSALANGTITTPNIDTFDVARIEVLRGPQGTLYGSSTLGGLLKIVTNAPSTDALAGKLQVGASDMNNGGSGWSIKGMLNVPLSDNTALRVVAYHDVLPGYIDDPARGLQNMNYALETGGRAALQINVSDAFDVRFSAIVQDIKTGNDSATDFDLVGLNYVPKYGAYQQQRDFRNPGYAHNRVFNGTANYNFGWGTLTSSTSYDTFRDDVFTDAGGAIFPTAGVDGRLAQNKFTQELRLASPTNDGPLEWLAGFYYTNETARLHQDIVAGFGGPSLAFLELDSNYRETAGFANLTYHFNDQFDVGVGGRYSHNEQAANQFGIASAVGTSEGNVFTWSVAPRYHLDSETVIYGRVAKGFRPGGPNALPIGGGGPGVPAFYASDSLINYELGVKTDLFDGQVSLDADVFLIDWSDIQLLVVVGSPPIAVNSNGGSARSQGFEWNIGWRPIDGLSLSFNGAYTDAHLTAATDPATVGALSGARLPWSPRWNVALDADYEFSSVGNAVPFIGASWRYVGDRDADFTAGAVPNQFPIKAYDTFAVRGGVTWDSWKLELYGKNLGNAKGITAFGQSGTSAASGLAATGAVIAPREIGVVVSTDF